MGRPRSFSRWAWCLALVCSACARGPDLTGQASSAPPATAPSATLPAASAAPATTQPIRYRMLDCHLHLVDFLQRTDAAMAALAAMDKCGVEEAVVKACRS